MFMISEEDLKLIKEVVDMAPEEGFASGWLREQCKKRGVKLPRSMDDILEDMGYIKTRVWHKPRINTFNSSING